MTSSNTTEMTDQIFAYCDEELIHLPGSIQPYGVLLVLSEPHLTILQISANTDHFFGISPNALLNQSIQALLNPQQISLLRRYLSHQNLKVVNPLPFALATLNSDISLDGIIHRNPEGHLILELLPSSSSPSHSSAPLNLFNLLRAATFRIHNAQHLEELCQITAQEIRAITGYDRVMIYRFDPDGHGEVIAEEKEDYLEPWLGLHYPATDIPRRARQLYCANWIRLIAEVNYQPSPLIPLNHPVTQQPLDLSLAVLRSVSPNHVEYLQNMYVSATMTISLMKENQLWGLVACHHYTSKYVSYDITAACELVGNMVSLELASKDLQEDAEYKLLLRSIPTKLLELMSSAPDFVEGLVKQPEHLLNLVGATGAVISFQEQLTPVGNTPPLEAIHPLIEWVSSRFQEGLFYTDSLPQVYEAAHDYRDLASGLLSISIPPYRQHCVLWFRPEVQQSVKWAGNPHQPVEVSHDSKGIKFSPRNSFELWQEIVQLKSLAWKPCEIEAALELRSTLIGIVLRQAKELAQLNATLQKSEQRLRERTAQLERTLQELQHTQTQLIQTEKMSSLGQLVAGVAHEINNPINFIQGNLDYASTYVEDLLNLVQLFQQYYPNLVPEIQTCIEEIELGFVQEDLPKLIASMRIGVDRIQNLVLSLRNFSRLDEAAIKPVDIHEGIDSTLVILQHRLKAKAEYPTITVIREYGNLPLVECYASQLNQVFMNVLANAIDALEEYRQAQMTSLESPLPDTSYNHFSANSIPASQTAHPSTAVLSDDTASQASTFQPTIHIRTTCSPNNCVTICIKDNGPGIPPEYQTRLFNPFFTSKPTGKGTGLGLSISHQIIVEKHGGKMACHSQPGQGAEFVIEIPVRQLHAASCS